VEQCQPERLVGGMSTTVFGGNPMKLAPPAQTAASDLAHGEGRFVAVCVLQSVPA
jgi:hypothetical protein